MLNDPSTSRLTIDVFGKRSSIANIIQSARNITGKGMFDDQHEVQAEIYRHNDIISDQLVEMKKEIDEDEYLQRLREPEKYMEIFSESMSMAHLSNSCPGSPVQMA